MPRQDEWPASGPTSSSKGELGLVVLYEYELTSGERYRNAEYIRVRDGQLVATQVFFGGRVG